MSLITSFWNHPTPRGYERLVRANVQHVGKEQGFKEIEHFMYSRDSSYVILSRGRIDVFLSIIDNTFVVLEWSDDPKHKDPALKYTVKLDDYPIVKELAEYLFRPKQ